MVKVGLESRLVRSSSYPLSRRYRPQQDGKLCLFSVVLFGCILMLDRNPIIWDRYGGWFSSGWSNVRNRPRCLLGRQHSFAFDCGDYCIQNNFVRILISNVYHLNYGSVCRKPHLEPILSTLQCTLASHRPNDEVSGEIAELISFEEIELVMEIMANRALVSRDVNSFTFLSQYSRNWFHESFLDI